MKTNEFIKYNEISGFQLFLLVYLTQVGVGLLTLPRTVTAEAGSDGWICVLIAMLLALVVTAIHVSLSNRFRGLTLVEITRRLFGKYFGTVVSILYVVYFTMVAAFELRSIADLVAIWGGVGITLWTNLLLTIVPTIYIARNGLKVIARSFNFYIYHLVPLYLTILWTAGEFEWRLILPIGTAGPMHLLKGIHVCMFVFLGLEMILFIGPMVQNPKKIMLSALLGTIAAGLTYTTIVFLCIGFFGTKEMQWDIWPALYMARAVKFALVERVDFFVNIIWVIIGFSTLAMYYYLSGFSLSRVLNIKDHKNMVLYICPVVLVLAYLPRNISQVIEYTVWINRLAYFTVGVLPVVLLITAWLTGKKERYKGEEN